jgi:hypothetical protein
MDNKGSYGNVLLALAALTASSVALGQAADQKAKECYEPGHDGPTFTVTLDGASVSKVRSVSVSTRTNSPVPQNRNFLARAAGSGAVGPITGPGVFKATVVIPLNAVEGEYSLNSISAVFDGFGIDYSAGKDFAVPPPFKVCNNPLVAPTVKGVTEQP